MPPAPLARPAASRAHSSRVEPPSPSRTRLSRGLRAAPSACAWKVNVAATLRLRRLSSPRRRVSPLRGLPSATGSASHLRLRVACWERMGRMLPAHHAGPCNRLSHAREGAGLGCPGRPRSTRLSWRARAGGTHTRTCKSHGGGRVRHESHVPGAAGRTSSPRSTKQQPKRLPLPVRRSYSHSLV